MRMLLALALLALLAAPVLAQEPPEGALKLSIIEGHPSTPVAEAYLALVDSMVVAGGPCTVPPRLKRMMDATTMPPEQLCPFLAQMRGPAGKVRARTLMSHQPIPPTQKAPPGEYLILLFDTVTDRGRYLERVIVRGVDRNWFIAGHQMKLIGPVKGQGKP